MTEAQINHFLVVYDIPNGLAHVDSFGRDYDAALAAYSAAEEKYRENTDMEVVLLGSDSIETLARTHSSYFELAEQHVDRLVARDLAEFGLR